MTRGKRVCKILKEIRQQIADKNDIEYITSECHFQDECKGTCPKCEAEVKYLEDELRRRRQLGKVATIAGISLGVVGTFSTCNNLQQTNIPILEQETANEKVNTDSVSSDTISSKQLKHIPFYPVSVVGDIDATDTIEDYWFTTDGIIIPNDEWNSDLSEDYIYIITEINPEYPEGDEKRNEFIKNTLIYPKEAQEKGIQGTVYVGFVVEKDGTLSDIKVLRGIGGGCDEEAIRIVKMMPKWKPGAQSGEIVRIRYNMPVRFVLDDK